MANSGLLSKQLRVSAVATIHSHEIMSGVCVERERERENCSTQQLQLQQ